MAEKKYKFRGIGLTPAEKKSAGRKYKEYLRIYPEASYSDLQLLEELVYRETIQERCKKEIEDKVKKKDKDGKIIPGSMTKIPKAFNDNLELIIELKERLGLFKDKSEQDPFEHFNVLEKKFNIWKNNHIEERAVDCPFCSEKFFLNIRTDKYQESNLKLFKNKILCNEHLWNCYKEGKIIKEDVAKILGVSKDYIDWLEKKIYDKPSK